MSDTRDARDVAASRAGALLSFTGGYVDSCPADGIVLGSHVLAA